MTKGEVFRKPVGKQAFAIPFGATRGTEITHKCKSAVNQVLSRKHELNVSGVNMRKQLLIC